MICFICPFHAYLCTLRQDGYEEYNGYDGNGGGVDVMEDNGYSSSYGGGYGNVDLAFGLDDGYGGGLIEARLDPKSGWACLATHPLVETPWLNPGWRSMKSSAQRPHAAAP